MFGDRLLVVQLSCVWFRLDGEQSQLLASFRLDATPPVELTKQIPGDSVQPG